ncbi:MAG: ribose 5-phosphate isomerase B [Pseudoflavonifractor sp.]|nr:ribose 5-phosphate isomerase B [Pseudoflavonifractor sp.]
MSIIEGNKKVALCSDHAGYELKSIIEGYLDAQEISWTDFGTHSADSCDYPDFAHPCAEAVESGECYPGIAMCGSGNGIAMTLNKHQGIRAAICWTVELARLARQHNDANVLVLPARFIEPVVALQIVDAFLGTPFEGGRHVRRVEKIPVKSADKC